MSVFYNNDITNKGRRLFALMQDGGKFMPTRIVMGSGYMPQGTTTRTINNVVIPFATLEINKSSPKENGDFMLGGLFTNSDLTQDEYFRELGLYAKVQKSDGSTTEEVLYSYGNALDNAELIPKYGVDTAIERQLDIITYVGNDANVVVEVSSGIFVDKKELSEELAKKENKSTVSVITLSAAAWDESAKTYSLESQYPHANYNLEIALNGTATAEQAEAFNGAQIVGNAASNVIKAYGDVPTVDIPVILKVVAK